MVSSATGLEREARKAVDREGPDGLTGLGGAAYALFAEGVARWLNAGANPHQESSFAGGCSPVLLAIAGYVDKAETGDQAYQRVYAAECVRVLEVLREADASFQLPASVLLEPPRLEELLAASKAAGFDDLWAVLTIL